jgi:hypothetical protein
MSKNGIKISLDCPFKIGFDINAHSSALNIIPSQFELKRVHR